MQGSSDNFKSVPHSHFLTESALLACGLEQETRSSIPKQIWNIEPHGGTAMRDALIYGNGLMTKLHKLLETNHTAENWAFLHILITDGHDTDSKASFKQTAQMLSTLQGDLNVRNLKIIIFGVDIEDEFAQSIRELMKAAGIHGQYHDITHSDIHQMFHRIRENEGLQNWNLRKNVSSMEFINEHLVENYAVLFTLDISGSMQGHRWNVTRHATIDFIKYLENNDVVSSVVFNESPHLVMHWSTKQNQSKLIQMEVARPFDQIMKNQPYFDPHEFKQVKQNVDNSHSRCEVRGKSCYCYCCW